MRVGHRFAELVESGKERRRRRYGQDIRKIAKLRLIKTADRQPLQITGQSDSVIAAMDLIAI